MTLQGMPGMMVQGAGGQVTQNCPNPHDNTQLPNHVIQFLCLQATVQYSGQPTGPGGSRLVGFPGTAPSTVTSQVDCLTARIPMNYLFRAHDRPSQHMGTLNSSRSSRRSPRSQL